MKKILATCLVLKMLIAIFAIGILEEDRQLKKSVYVTLEKENLTEDDKDFIRFATDPREMKESYISLDVFHQKLFDEHFN